MSNLFTEYLKCSEELAKTKKELQKIKEQLEEAHQENLLLTEENFHLKNSVEIQKLPKNEEINDKLENMTLYDNNSIKDFNGVSWIKDRIHIFDGSVKTDNGKVVNFRDFKEIIENRPWILFPEQYEVQCHDVQCRNIISLIYFRQDKCSVYCPRCQSPTVLENAAYGHRWVLFTRCKHFQHIAEEDTDLQFCEFCDTEGRYMVITDRFVRLPKEKNMDK